VTIDAPDLCWCVAPASLAGALWAHQINGAMTADIADKIEDEGVLLARSQARNR